MKQNLDVLAMLAVTVAGICYTVKVAPDYFPVAVIAILGTLTMFATLGSRRLK